MNWPGRSGGHGHPGWATVAAALGSLLLLYYAVPVAALLFAQSPGVVLDRVGDRQVTAAGATSVVTATTATAIAVVLGVPLAHWLARTRGRVAGLATGIVVLPLVLPPVVSGLLVLSVVGAGTPLGAAARAAGVPLSRSLAGIVLAQTFVASPFVVLTAKAAFEGIDHDLEDAARTLGDGPFRTFRRVTLPLAWPGVLAGATLAFARAIGEFGATLTLAPFPRTLPVQVDAALGTGGVEEAYAVSLVLLCVSVLALAGLAVLGRLGSAPLR